MLQSYFPEWVIQALMGIGVVIGAAFGGLRLFGAGQRANAPERKAAESDLRKRIEDLDDKHSDMHAKTHEKLGDMHADLAFLKGATRRD